MKQRIPTIRPDVLRVLSDNNWHTLSEIYSLVKDKIPDNRAIDAYMKNNGIVNSPQDSKIEKGRKTVVIKILSLLVHSKRVIFSAEETDWKRKYRLL